MLFRSVVPNHGRGRASFYLAWCGHHYARNLGTGPVSRDQVIIDARKRLYASETSVHA